MKNEAKARGAAKGRAMRAAKKQARETGQPVAVAEYGATVMPDGSVAYTGGAVSAPQAPLPADVAAMIEAPAAPSGMMAELQGYLEKGLSEEDALHLVNRKRGQAPASAGRATPTSPDEPQGPDPAMIAAYQAKLATYVPPKTEESFTVVLPVRFADYIRRAAMLQTVARGENITPERAIDLIIRKAKQNDQNDALMMSPGSKTGPKDAFQPVAGAWQP